VAYTTVLFDLDHTLMDSTQSEIDALANTFSSHGVDATDDLLADYHRINKALWGALERGELGVNRLRVQRFEELVTQRSLDADPERLADDFSHWLGQCGELYDGALTMLESLHDRVRVALVTNGVGSTQRARVKRLGLTPFLDATVISGEFGSAKPGRAIFDEALRLLGSDDRDATLMVGDSLSSDVEGANNAGVAACWFNPHGAECAFPVHIDHVVRTLPEVLLVVLSD
jgi:2-haloacid dehalogenase